MLRPDVLRPSPQKVKAVGGRRAIHEHALLNPVDKEEMPKV